jgi:riboflavin transporter FmnP
MLEIQTKYYFCECGAFSKGGISHATCTACEKLAIYPLTQNPFKLFGLRINKEVTEEELTNTYLKIKNFITSCDNINANFIKKTIETYDYFFEFMIENCINQTISPYATFLKSYSKKHPSAFIGKDKEGAEIIKSKRMIQRICRKFWTNSDLKLIPSETKKGKSKPIWLKLAFFSIILLSMLSFGPSLIFSAVLIALYISVDPIGMTIATILVPISIVVSRIIYKKNEKTKKSIKAVVNAACIGILEVMGILNDQFFNYLWTIHKKNPRNAKKEYQKWNKETKESFNKLIEKLIVNISDCLYNSVKDMPGYKSDMTWQQKVSLMAENIDYIESTLRHSFLRNMICEMSLDYSNPNQATIKKLIAYS